MNENKGKMPTKVELTLEQPQQGVSDDVLAETGSIHNLSVFTKMIVGIEEIRHGPSDAMHNPSRPFKFLSTDTLRIGHVGSRGQYNGKQLGTNYAGGKCNFAISFMFFNFSEERGMGRLWMIFKKYGTVDVEGLLGQLKKIKIGEEFVDVVNGGNNKDGDVKYKEKVSKGMDGERVFKEKISNDRDGQHVGKEGLPTDRAVKGPLRTIKFEIKLLGGLEVMVMLKNEDMASNVLTNKDHGMRRWLYNLKRGDSFHRTSGRITRITILRVLVSCWGEVIIKKVAALHGTIMRLHNCRLEGTKTPFLRGLEGNQNTVFAREMRDITNLNIKEGVKENPLEYNDMQVDDKDDDEDGEPNSEDDGSSDDEEGGGLKVGYDGGNKPISDPDGRNAREDEGSRFSGETRVDETFKGDYDSSKNTVNEEAQRLYGEHNIKTNEKKEGGKCNDENDINVESKKCEVLVDINSTVVKDINMPNKNGIGPFGNGIGLVGDSWVDKSNGPCNASDKSCGLEDNNASGPKISNNISGKKGVSKSQKRNNIADEVRNDELEQDSLWNRREKREVSPASSMGSGGDMLRKKRKANYEKMFKGDELEMNFNQGKTNGLNIENKKKIGRRSVKKAIAMARKTRVDGLGENKKGFQMCIKNNMMWKARAMRGMGDSGKKGWIRSIIRDERPDVIGLQEIKCGIVDDMWVEDIWGGQGFEYSQLPANRNSGGEMMIDFIPRVSDDGMKFGKLDRFLLNEKFNDLWDNLSVIALDRKLSDHCPIVLKDVKLDFGPKPFRVFNVWMDEPDFMRVVEEA
ncbi:transposon TX1 [Tanacetum coccineum]